MDPQDITEVRFSRAPLGSRGYNEDEVDSFLDLVYGEFLGMRARIEELESSRQIQVAAPQHPQPNGDQVMKVLTMAQEMADRLTGEAKTESSKVLQDARYQADQLLSEARATAYQVSQEAEAQREMVLGTVAADKSKLETEISKLREFETEYRRNLKNYLKTLQDAVDTGGNK
jgi:DivIVA domain-containing protein